MKRNLFLMLGLVLLCNLAAGRRTFADVPTWQPVSGPYGGSVSALALSPNYAADHTVFAGLRGHGVYRSVDSGSSWQPAGPADWVVAALAISPHYAADQTLFVSAGLPTTAFKVYRSTDEGGSWQDVTPTWAGPPNAPGFAISPHFANDQTLYVLGGFHTYVSTDGGDTFTAAGGWLAAHNVVQLAFSPAYATDRTLFALVRDAGLFKSTDGGTTWNPTGLSGDLSTFAVSPDYANDRTLIAADRFSGEVRMSADGGDIWTPAGLTLATGGQHTLFFSLTFVTDCIILAASSADPGIYRSEDGGTTWSLVGEYELGRSYPGGFVGGAVFALAVAPDNSYDGSAFAGTSGGIYLSSNRGLYWYQHSDGLARLTVRALAVAPGDPATLLAGTSFFETRINGQPDEYDGDLRLSTDGGRTWRVTSARLARVHSVTFSPGFAADRTAFAATGTPGEHGLADGGVYRSTDGGLNWTRVLSGTMVEALALSPDLPQDRTLWASTFSSEAVLGIYVSTDGGDHWEVLTPSVRARVLVPSPNYGVDRTLFAGTGERGLLKSTDDGLSWTEVLTRPVTALAVSPAYGASQTLYAGVQDGNGLPGELYRSEDGGVTWQRLDTGIPPTWEGQTLTISSLAFALDGSVLAGVSYGREVGGGAVYRSVDGGTTWQPVGGGLGAHNLFALATAPGRSLSFYAGTDGGLFRFEVVQGGPAEPGTWESSGPRGGRAQALAVSPDFVHDGVAFAGGWLYGRAGGASGTGIRRSTDGGQTWQPSASGTESVYYNYGSAILAYAFSPDFATDRTVFAGTWGGLVKSSDGGEHWQWLTRVYFGPPGTISAVAVAPDFAHNGRVMASSWGRLYLSQDGGVHWTPNYSLTAIGAIAYSPDFISDGVAFAGGFNGLHKASNGGSEWTQVLTQPISALAISPQYGADGTLFASSGDSLNISHDGGMNWVTATVAADGSTVRALAISPSFASDRTLFAGTNSGLHRSDDGGISWDAVVGYAGLAVQSLAISPGWPDHAVLLVGTDLGVYRTTDGGLTWALGEGLATLSTGAVALSPGGDLLLTGAVDHGVYGSTDGGKSWLPLGLQGAGMNYGIPGVAISPAYASDRTFFAVSASSVSIGASIHRTTDGGATWERVYTTDYIGQLAISPWYADDRTVYAAGNNGRVLRSTDGGRAWDLVGNWPSGTYTGIARVALPPNYPEDGVVFAGGQGFWRLPPGAMDWQLASGLDSAYRVGSIAVSPSYAADRTLLATAYWFAGPAGPLRYSVFRSTDGGENWQPSDAGLVESEEMHDVAFSPHYGLHRTAYATSNSQLYRSLDGGQSWTGVGAPPGSPLLYDVAVDRAGDVIVASSAGVWRYTTAVQDMIVNGGFEAASGWTMPDTPRPAAYSDQAVYDGRRSVRIGIVNGENGYAYSSAQQTVTLPVDTLTATLSLSMYPVSGESASVAQHQVPPQDLASGVWPPSSSSAMLGDAQYVLVLHPDGTILGTLLWLSPSNGQSWQRRAFDLTPYAGQTIVLHLGVRNDGQGGWTGMYVDDVSLVVARRVVDMPVHAYLPLAIKEYPAPSSR